MSDPWGKRPAAGGKAKTKTPGGTYRKQNSAPPQASLQQQKTKPKQRIAKVILRINGTPYERSSSSEFGHAEMAALRDFLWVYKGQDIATPAAVLDTATKTVECHNQPVCPSCGLVLKALGFTVADTQTIWGTEKAGGVSWAANWKVKQLLDHLQLSQVYIDAINLGRK